MGNRFREKETEEGLEYEVSPAGEQDLRQGQRPRDREASPAGEQDLGQEQFPHEEEEQQPRRGRSDKVAKGLSKVLGGDILGDKFVLNQIKLMLLCLFFLLLLVANRYEVESLSREKMASLERINDLREHRIQMQKQYQKSVKISQIAEELSDRGVGITSGPPYEIED